MIKRMSYLTLVALGIAVAAGCSEGRRGMSIHGPYHDVNLAYDIEHDDDGGRDFKLVRVIERHD